MMAYGMGDCLWSLLMVKFPTTGLLGRNVPMFLATVMDLANLITCLLWKPGSNNWVVFVFFFVFGSSDGIWQTVLNSESVIIVYLYRQ